MEKTKQEQLQEQLQEVEKKINFYENLKRKKEQEQEQENCRNWAEKNSVCEKYKSFKICEHLNILKNNKNILFKKINMPIIVEIINKYAGKRAGEKPKEKINNEIKEACGGVNYFFNNGRRNGIFCLGYRFEPFGEGFTICCKRGFINNENIIQLLNIEDFEDLSETFIKPEDITQFIKDVEKEKKEIEEKKEELRRKEDNLIRKACNSGLNIQFERY